MASARVAPASANLKLPFYRTPLGGALVIAAAVLLAYHNSFNVPFVFDDEMAIVANSSLHNLWTACFPPPDLTGLPISGRPVVNFSLGLSYALSGNAVWSYHVFNLLVHISAGLVLFGVVRRTLTSSVGAQACCALGDGRSKSAPLQSDALPIALVAALLWTLHPLQTESVTFISQRAEALLGLFYLLTLWCFIRAVEPGAPPKWARWAFVTCLLGMATKEVMVSAPLFVVLYDRAFVAGSWREVWARHRKIHLALASTWLLLAWFVLQEGGARGVSAGFGLGVSWWTYLLKQCDAIVLYLKLSFWPHPLVLDYGTGLVRSVADVWWQAAVMVALFAGTLWALVRKPALGCVGAWFFMILAPSSSVVPLVGQTVAEHRMYLPLAAVVVLAVTWSYLRFGRKALVVLAAIGGLLIAVTVGRNEDYSSAIGICEDTVAKCPGNARARALLADYYRRAGRLDDARKQLERSLELEPGVRPVLNNLGDVWQELGQPAKAVVCFQQALALKPGDAATLNNLGNALILSGHVPEGIAQLETALRLDPAASATRANLANALARSGRMPEAAACFASLLQARPDDADAHSNYGNVLLALGRGAEAMAQWETAVRLQPDNADLHNRLGIALGRAGRLREALEQFQTALRLNPAHASARQNAALAQRKLGDN
jgi:Flp pilus assembly protein TadD